MKIITLIDNVVYGSGLTAEHGFSLMIESGNKKILFDTGQSGNFINNASILGVDITQIDYCIISHGHYDHTGGLYEFIKYNKKSKIYLKKECFYEKYRLKEKFIGIPFNKNIFTDRLIFTNNIIEISKDIFIFPEIKIYFENDRHYRNMFIKKNNDYIPDDFTDEQFLAIRKNNSLIIISGCSHRGITNIIKTAKDYFNLPVKAVLGGFHYKDEDETNILTSVKTLNDMDIESIGISHCTGINAYQIINNNYKKNVFYNYTGKITEI